VDPMGFSLEGEKRCYVTVCPIRYSLRYPFS